MAKTCPGGALGLFVGEESSLSACPPPLSDQSHVRELFAFLLAHLSFCHRHSSGSTSRCSSASALPRWQPQSRTRAKHQEKGSLQKQSGNNKAAEGEGGGAFSKKMSQFPQNAATRPAESRGRFCSSPDFRPKA